MHIKRLQTLKIAKRRCFHASVSSSLVSFLSGPVVKRCSGSLTKPGDRRVATTSDDEEADDYDDDGDDGDDGFVVELGFVCPLRRKTSGIVLIVSRHERQRDGREGV